MALPEKLFKPYDPKATEERIYKIWEESGFFSPDKLPGERKEAFTIIMPPPNANGKVHLGHAAFVTPEDVMVRFERMRGKKTLWLPGTDHAGFETQVVFEKELEKKGSSRFKMTREEFYKETWDFVQENKRATEEGLRGLGASCDWSRNIFTLDPRIIKIVYQTFEKMYQDGLIYRGNRICNWCPKHGTGLSDLETAYEERIDPLYYIKYGPFTLATVRPETKFGDTAVAVNPKDRRYKKYIGRDIEVEGLLGKFKMKVIADELVDKDFGTGVIKVTPAHDAVDFEIWQKHKDEIPGPKQVIDQRGKIDLPGTKYHGLKVAEARKVVVEDLRRVGLIEKVDEDYKHNVALCYKCRSVIEPLIIPQWYVAMTKEVNGQSLRDMGLNAVKKGQVKIIPDRFRKVYEYWMKNIRDWPISRQIWWGIPIPVWYKDEEIHVGEKSPGPGWTQDPDTFDTWFSSGQWPYAALKANSEEDLKNFYPTDVMETGWEILFFWVARMIIFGLYLTGKAPFHTVYLHGILRDQEGKKMSKSKGNVINPKVMTEKYGTDALRMAITVGNLPGVDSALSEDKIRAYSKFANKLWNITRFVLENTKGECFKKKEKNKLTREFDKFAKGVTTDMQNFRFYLAAEKIYHYIWHRFADEIIEESKKKEETKSSLMYILENSLKLLHPFMPFITEEIWSTLPWQKGLLMVEKWPFDKAQGKPHDN